MTTPGQKLFTETTGRDADNWAHMDPISHESWEMRARGELHFIPSRIREVVEPEPEVLPTMPFTSSVRLATKAEIPRSTTTLWKTALKAGWWCYITRAYQPWLDISGELKTTTAYEAGRNLDTSPVPVYGMAETIKLVGVRPGHRFEATWVRKTWTADSDKFKYESGRWWPLGGGLLKSAVLTKRIKEV